MLKDTGTWLARKGIWFVIILIGLIAYWNLHPVWDKLEQEAEDAELSVTTQQEILKEIYALQAVSIEAIEDAQHETTALLDQRIELEVREIQELTSKRDTVGGFGISKEIKVKHLDFKLDFATWRKNEYTRLRNERLNEVQRQSQVPITQAQLEQKREAYKKQWEKHQEITTGINTKHSFIDNQSSLLINKANNLLGWSGYEIKDANASHKELVSINNEIEALQSELDHLRQPKKSIANPMPSAENFKDVIAGLVKNATDAYERSWFHKRIIQPASEYWPTALTTVILAILLSPLARLVCFYLLAPLAARQSPIVLHSNVGGKHEVKDQGVSNSGISVNLLPGQTLVAHHDYVKAMPKICTTSTQFLLDQASPISSLFSGLYNLLRAETSEATTIAMSSGHDGLNELICINLTKDAEISIEPRNIVGVITVQGSPINLKKHWILDKLQSWLKWQFRYITISGPITLMLKGGRGLTVSQVESELVIASEYVVGFSSHLGYGTSRCETFGGYYSRKKSLLNDRFIGKTGVVIHQEANFATGSHKAKTGIEGIMDGFLKAFGI